MSIALMILLIPREGEASTRFSRNLSLLSSIGSGGNQPLLLEAGLNVQVIPAIRKINTTINIPFRFTYTAAGGKSDFKPLATGVYSIDLSDLSGEYYNVNLQYGRFLVVNNDSQLTDNTIMQAGLSVKQTQLPGFSIYLTKTESSVNGKTTSAETTSLLTNYGYNFKYLGTDFSAAYSLTKSLPANELTHGLDFTVARTTEIFPSTSMTVVYNFGRSIRDSNNPDLESSSSTTHIFNARLNSTPVEWLNLNANYHQSISDSTSAKNNQQTTELTPSFLVFPSFKISPSAGLRSFDDAGKRRNITFYGISGDYSVAMQEKVLLAMRGSRFYESDPGQGDDARDNFGLNSVIDLLPGVAVRLGVDITRRDNANFVNTKFFDAAGTLAARDNLASFASNNKLNSGFVFFDTINNDLYTLIDPATATSAAVWSAPAHFEPTKEEFTVAKNLQISMIPTERSNISLTYTSSAQSGRLDMIKAGSQTVSGAFTYYPNRRTSFNLSGTASFPEGSKNSFSTVTGLSYNFFKGQRMNLNFAYPTGDKEGTLSGGFSIPFRKKTQLGFNYSITDLLGDNQNYIFNLTCQISL